MSQNEIVQYITNTNSELKATYEWYQGLINSLKENNFNKFKSIILHPNKNISDKMKQALKLYNNNLKYIENSFKYEINNGIIEETNNLIKCLKRIAFGYRKYDHFIARIFLIKCIIKEWLKITPYNQFIYQIYCSPTLFDKEPNFFLYR